VPLLEQVLEQYPNQVKLVYKNFPLRNHKFAKPAASAALAAGEQGKFWEFHDKLFQNYNQLRLLQKSRGGRSPPRGMPAVTPPAR
jgi:protein-disulfide isomerase